MATYKLFDSKEIKSDRDTLEQLVDILGNDISGSVTRKKAQVWVTGGVGPGVTSSLFQTVFDQDFTLQTANGIFDITFGLSANSDLVQTGSLALTDSTTGQYYFSSQSIQMREKIAIYKLFAQNLLGDASDEFSYVSASTTTTLREPLFISFKRLFSRDRIKRESFAIRLYQSASRVGGNLFKEGTGTKIYTDVGAASNIESSFGGQVSTIFDSANSTYPVGLLYLDKGVAVLDTQRVFDQTSVQMTGTIHGMSAGGLAYFSGTLNSLMVSASIDDVLDHICSTRFSGSALTAIAFQNQTYLNSTYFFCNFGADEFNYSSNPTYIDSNKRIVVIESGQEDAQQAFSYVTSIGLYDVYNNCLGVAKLSRPVLKDPSRAFTVKVRMDF